MSPAVSSLALALWIDAKVELTVHFYNNSTQSCSQNHRSIHEQTATLLPKFSSKASMSLHCIPQSKPSSHFTPLVAQRA